MTLITAIASQKGGTGKTTTAIALAAGLTHKMKRVLLIDMDSQANSSKVLLPAYQDLKRDQTAYATIISQKPLPILQTTVPNLDIAASHILLSNTDIELTTALDHREARHPASANAAEAAGRVPPNKPIDERDQREDDDGRHPELQC